MKPIEGALPQPRAATAQVRGTTGRPGEPGSEEGPDSAKAPIKLPESPSDTQPETPKVGTADAPGG